MKTSPNAHDLKPNWQQNGVEHIRGNRLLSDSYKKEREEKRVNRMQYQVRRKLTVQNQLLSGQLFPSCLQKENSLVSDHDVSLLAYDTPVTHIEQKRVSYMLEEKASLERTPSPKKMKITLSAGAPEAERNMQRQRERENMYAKDEKGEKTCIQSILKRKMLLVL